MKQLNLLFSSILTLFCYAQEPTGFVASGSLFSVQSIDMNTDEGLGEKSIKESDFEIVVNATDRWISIQGITGFIDNEFDFDSIRLDDQMETTVMKESYASLGFEHFKQLDFDVDYVAEVLDGGLHPVIVSLMYDEESESPKFYASFTQKGKTFFYNFYLDDIKYLNWSYGTLFKKRFDCSEVSYFEQNEEGEYIEKYTHENKHQVQLEDDFFSISGPDLQLSGLIKGRFHDTDEAHFVVGEYLISISKEVFNKTIVISSDYNEETGSFKKIFGFSVMSAWDEE